MYAEQLTESASIKAKQEFSKLAFDRTINAEIFQVLDINTGVYRIRYQNALMTAYVEDVSKQYKQGDKVFVKIIGGDFSNQKIIEGKVKADSIDEVTKTELENSFFPVCDNLLTSNSELKIFAGKKSQEQNNKYSILKIAPNMLKDFEWYHGKYEYLELSAEFKTLLTKQFTSYGSYGLMINGTTKNGKKNQQFTYIFDTNDFNGKIYEFNSYVRQSIIIPLPKNMINSIASIKLFATNFSISDSDSYGENEYDIYAKNISIRFMEKQDLTKNPYFLRILTNSHYFIDGTPTIDLKCSFLHKGKVIVPDSIYWFKKDVLIDSVDKDDYNKDAGIGWRLIEGENDKDICTIGKGVVEYQQEFKLIVFYQGVKYSATTLLENITNQYAVTIEQKQRGKRTILALKVKEKGQFITNFSRIIWSTLTTSGIVLLKNTEKNENNTVEDLSEVDITDSLNYSKKVFYCDVFIGGLYLCTATYYFTQTQEKNDRYQVLFSGQDMFKYDANGNISLPESEKKYSISAEVIPLEDLGTNLQQLKYTWFLNPTDEDLSNNSYNIKNSENQSMIIGINSIPNGVNKSLVEGQNPQVDFSIKNKYNINQSKNVLYLRIYNPQTEQIDYFTKELIFLKDGMLGTNGTEYSLRVTADNPYFIWNQSDQSNQITCTAKIFKNGVEIINHGGTFSWLLPDANNNEIQIIENNTNSCTFKLKTSNLEAYLQKRISYVKVSFTKQENNRPIFLSTIYAFDFLIEEPSYYIDLALKNNRKWAYNGAIALRAGKGGIYPFCYTGKTIPAPFQGRKDISELVSCFVKGTEQRSSTPFQGKIYPGEPTRLILQKNPYYKSDENNLDSNYYFEEGGLASKSPFRISGLGENVTEEDLIDNTIHSFPYKLIAPKEVIYSATGLYPQCEDSHIYVKNDEGELINVTTATVIDQKTNSFVQFSPDESIVNSPINFKERFIPTSDQECIEIIKISSPFVGGVFYHSIVAHLNTYGNENINGWDGTAIKIDNDNNFILAPQIGAGTKINDKFSGVVMGTNPTDKERIGLYGFDKGISSFGFRSDGSAFLGKPGAGQILFNDDKPGVIESAGFDNGYHYNELGEKITTGTKIDLKNGKIEIKGSKDPEYQRVYFYFPNTYYTLEKLNEFPNNNSCWKVISIDENDVPRICKKIKVINSSSIENMYKKIEDTGMIIPIDSIEDLNNNTELYQKDSTNNYIRVYVFQPDIYYKIVLSKDSQKNSQKKYYDLYNYNKSLKKIDIFEDKPIEGDNNNYYYKEKNNNNIFYPISSLSPLTNQNYYYKKISNENSRGITIDSGAKTYPLKIENGDTSYFKVAWDGSLSLKGYNQNAKCYQLSGDQQFKKKKYFQYSSDKGYALFFDFEQISNFSPAEKGLFEKNQNEEYIQTTDIIFDENKIYFQTNGNNDYIEYSPKNLELFEPQENNAYFINLDPNSERPLVIGEYFHVNWDGSLFARSGSFTGTINAKSGIFNGTVNALGGTFSGSVNIGGNTFIGGNGIQGPGFFLNSSGLIINGGSITIGGITINSNGLSDTNNFILNSSGLTLKGTVKLKNGSLNLLDYLDLNNGNIKIGKLSDNYFSFSSNSISMYKIKSEGEKKTETLVGAFSAGKGSSTTETEGKVQTTETDGIVIKGAQNTPYIIITSAGIRLQGTNGCFGITDSGKLFYGNKTVNLSDIVAKFG